MKRKNAGLQLFMSVIILLCTIWTFSVPGIFATQGNKEIKSISKELQITNGDIGSYENIGVVDSSNLVVVDENSYYINGDGKLMIGFVINGEFQGRATTEEETMSYIKFLYNSGDLEITNGWAVSSLWEEFDDVRLLFLKAGPTIAALFIWIFCTISFEESNKK